MSEKQMNLWWGYLHVNGSIQAKRFFSAEDIDEAVQSDFVRYVHGPFEAADREDALNELKRVLK